MDELFRKNLRFLSAQMAQGKGQVAAGESAGVSQSAVSKIASGSTEKPSFQTMIGLARHYGVSLDDLANRDLEIDGSRPSSQPARFDDETMAQAVALLHLMGDARPEDARFQRITWSMIQVAAKGVKKAERDMRGAMADILAELAEV